MSDCSCTIPWATCGAAKEEVRAGSCGSRPGLVDHGLAAYSRFEVPEGHSSAGERSVLSPLAAGLAKQHRPCEATSPAVVEKCWFLAHYTHRLICM